jgi:hypothetical protein
MKGEKLARPRKKPILLRHAEPERDAIMGLPFDSDQFENKRLPVVWG